MDESRLRELVGRVVGDMGAAFGAATVVLGDRLGLWRALAGAGAMTSADLAKATGNNERLVAEWLAAQAAAGYVDYADGGFTLTDEQATIFANDESPVFLTALAEVISSVYRDEAALVAAYRGEKALAWGEHDPALFSGTERFFRPGYAANLPGNWIPALDGVEAKLRQGGRIADVGCGHGASTVVLATTYPKATLTGYDSHAASIARARELAVQAGVTDRVSFELAFADDYPGNNLVLVCLFDCLHDMGDPVAALRHVRSTLADDGTVLLVEPFAHGHLPEDLNPVGRVFFNASATICVPNALSQGDGTTALGAQAGEDAILDVAREAGFSRTRLATSTPFNLVLELRP